VSLNVDVSGEIQTRVPHQIAALPARPFSRQIKREQREVALGAVHHAVRVEEGIFDEVHEQDDDDSERRVRGQSAAQKGRAGNVRVQVGQDHVDQVRQSFGPRRTVSVKKVSWFGSTRRRQWVPAR